MTKLNQDTIDRKAVEEAAERFVDVFSRLAIERMRETGDDVERAVEDMRRKSVLNKNKHWLWAKVKASVGEQLAS